MKRKKYKQGSAMVYVLAVMAVIVVLCLSLLLLSYSLFATSLNYGDQEQCQILAASLSNALQDELENDGKSWYIPYNGEWVDKGQKIYSYNVKNEDGSKIENTEASGLVTFITQNIWTENWPYYSEDEDDKKHNKKNAARKLQFDSEKIENEKFQKLAAGLTVEMYWYNVMADYDSAEASKKDDTTLVITVNCESGKNYSTITRAYQLSCSEDKSVPDGKYEIWNWSLTDTGDEVGEE